jgi:hypothetical protein
MEDPLVSIVYYLTKLIIDSDGSLIEGLPTILVGFLVLLLLPSRPETTKWLTEDERKLAQRRLNREVASEGRSINWKHVIMSFTDYKAWLVRICTFVCCMKARD